MQIQYYNWFGMYTLHTHTLVEIRKNKIYSQSTEPEPNLFDLFRQKVLQGRAFKLLNLFGGRLHVSGSKVFWMCQQQTPPQKKNNPKLYSCEQREGVEPRDACVLVELTRWPRLLHSQVRRAGSHLSCSSVVDVREWLKLRNTPHKQLNSGTMSLSLALSLFPPLSLAVHFSPVWAQGSWSLAMLSQQRRDADGRAAQSRINVHCWALCTWGREEKHQQWKRGRSLADNEWQCSVPPAGETEEIWRDWRGNRPSGWRWGSVQLWPFAKIL